MIPGSFQPLNLNGAFKGRQHCLVCENRLNPVALVFVKAHPEGVDPQVKKLLEALDRACEEHYLDTGMASFVVFLSPDARTGATQEASKDGDKVLGDKEKKDAALKVREEAVRREKLVHILTELSKPFKRVIVTCMPPEKLPAEYKLSDKAEVTIIEYARHQVFSNFAFAEGKLNQEGIDKALQAVDGMLERLKKSAAK
jgi:hypothetical protein